MRYGKYSEQQTGKPKGTVHPIWRGIGCVLFIITPIISFAIANLIILSGFLQQYIYLPRILMLNLTIPGIEFSVPAFLATLIVTVAVMLLFFSIYFTIYAGLYRIIGPSRLGPLDVPPLDKKKRKVRKSR